MKVQKTYIISMFETQTYDEHTSENQKNLVNLSPLKKTGLRKKLASAVLPGPNQSPISVRIRATSDQLRVDVSTLSITSYDLT